jgi:hypothetical protein
MIILLAGRMSEDLLGYTNGKSKFVEKIDKCANVRVGNYINRVVVIP